MKKTKYDLKKEIKCLRETVTLKCLECCNYQIQEVTECNVPGCPLWEERPKEAKGLYTLIKQLRQKNLVNIEA